MSDSTTTCERLAPEDLEEGDFVTVLRAVHEVPSFFWCADSMSRPPEKPIEYEYTPAHAGTPLRIESVCLPFLFVKHPDGSYSTIDIRRTQLARMPRGYAKLVIEKTTKQARGVNALR
jgi:hypothetical protein